MNDLRSRASGVGGLVEDAPLTSGATTLTSAGLAGLPAIGSTQHAAIIFDPDGITGAPYIKWVTAHTANATTATITAAGQEGTTERAIDQDTPWIHGPTLRDYMTTQFAKRTAGSLTLNSTTWATVPTISDLVLNAQVGDVMEYGINALMDSQAVNAFLDVETVAGSNYFGSGEVTSSTGNGLVGWLCVASLQVPITGSAFYIIQSADVASGQVALRLRYRTASATARTLFADTSNPLIYWVKNLGAQGY